MRPRPTSSRGRACVDCGRDSQPAPCRGSNGRGLDAHPVLAGTRLGRLPREASPASPLRSSLPDDSATTRLPFVVAQRRAAQERNSVAAWRAMRQTPMSDRVRYLPQQQARDGFARGEARPAVPHPTVDRTSDLHCRGHRPRSRRAPPCGVVVSNRVERVVCVFRPSRRRTGCGRAAKLPHLPLLTPGELNRCDSLSCS